MDIPGPADLPAEPSLTGGPSQHQREQKNHPAELSESTESCEIRWRCFKLRVLAWCVTQEQKN